MGRFFEKLNLDKRKKEIYRKIQKIQKIVNYLVYGN